MREDPGAIALEQLATNCLEQKLHYQLEQSRKEATKAKGEYKQFKKDHASSSTQDMGTKGKARALRNQRCCTALGGQ